MVEFADGSSGQLIYSAEGDSSFPKEELTVYGAGFVAEVTNFQQMTLHRGRKKSQFSSNSKGHAEQMEAWLGFLLGKVEHPLPLNVSSQSMLVTFAALDAIRSGQSVTLEGV